MRKGPIAQLVERLICNEEVSGSSPLGSTKRNLFEKRDIKYSNLGIYFKYESTKHINSGYLSGGNYYAGH